MLANLKKTALASRTKRRAVIEPLEARRVLDAGPLVISELMAVSNGTLAD